MHLSMLQLVDIYTLRQSRSVLVRCLHSECLLLFGLVYVKALIEIEVGECQIKVSTLELFSIQLTPSSLSAIICVLFPIGSPKFLYVLNLDKCSLAHETIINLKYGVLRWLRKGPRRSELHRGKVLLCFSVFEILTGFVFLCTCTDAWSNSWWWNRFGYPHE